MGSPFRYHTEDLTLTLPARDYLARFRDTARVEGYCRSCPQYGRSWGCPPFDFRLEELLADYHSVLLIATRITPQTPNLPMAQASLGIVPERIRLERRLLELEGRYGGQAFAYTGSCLYCPTGSCTRPLGLPCRHPDRVRPSLEGCGFDLGRTTAELFGFELKWGRDGLMPEYLTLVCGFFHHSNRVKWDE